MAVRWTLFLVAAFCLRLSSACMCDFAHPQQKFCRADFVLRAKVLDENVGYYPGSEMVSEKNYTVELASRNIYKGRDLFSDVRTAVIGTGPSEMQCGVTMVTGEEYVISGMVNSDGTFLTTTCEFVQPYKSLTSHHRRGLWYMYEEGCNCTVFHCRGDRCWDLPDPQLTFDDVCLWRDTWNPSDCYAQYAFCLRDMFGLCYWKENRKFISCLNEQERVQ